MTSSRRRFLTTSTAAAVGAMAILSAVEPATAQRLRTHLYDLQREYVRLDKPWEEGGGGAIASLGGDLLLVATPKGRLVLVHPAGDVDYLPADANVPMNLSALERNVSFDEDDRWSLHHFRVADILLTERTPTRFELYVTHHYFTGECNRFRLSSTSLRVVRPHPPIPGRAFVVEPSWRTIFDAEPCLPPRWFEGHQSGGKMLTDGPDHLLVIIGDHGAWRRFPGGGYGLPPRSTDPVWHIGKLVRVAIETGEAEILTAGHRNPQGLARDADGNLWSVEHGPGGGDELNLLEPGRNYGWPMVSYGIDRKRRILNESMVGRHDGFSPPVFSWVPAIAPTAIVVNDARSFPRWGNDLLIASLHAKSLFRVRRLGKTVQYVEPISMEGAPIRDLTWMPDGRLALMHASTDVVFLKIRPRGRARRRQ